MVHLLAVRGYLGPPGVSLLRRARLQGPLAIDPARQARPCGALEYANRFRDRHGRWHEDGEVCRDAALPSYLVAIAVGDMELVDAGTAGKKNTRIRIVVPHGRSTETQYAAETTPALLNLLENYF